MKRPWNISSSFTALSALEAGCEEEKNSLRCLCRARFLPAPEWRALPTVRDLRVKNCEGAKSVHASDRGRSTYVYYGVRTLHASSNLRFFRLCLFPSQFFVIERSVFVFVWPVFSPFVVVVVVVACHIYARRKRSWWKPEICTLSPWVI